jgi:hypothetical protein
MATSNTTTYDPAMELIFEFIAVGVFTILGGISDEFGKIVMVFMLGLWLIYMVTSPGAIEKIGGFFSKAAETSSGNAPTFTVPKVEPTATGYRVV